MERNSDHGFAQARFDSRRASPGRWPRHGRGRRAPAFRGRHARCAALAARAPARSARLASGTASAICAGAFAAVAGSAARGRGWRRVDRRGFRRGPRPAPLARAWRDCARGRIESAPFDRGCGGSSGRAFHRAVGGKGSALRVADSRARPAFWPERASPAAGLGRIPVPTAVGPAGAGLHLGPAPSRRRGRADCALAAVLGRRTV